MSAALLAWAAGYAMMLPVALLRRAPTVRACASPPARVLLLRPCAGVRGGMAEALTTVPQLAPGITLRWVGCVADADDPAWPLVQASAAQLRARGIDAHAMLTAAPGPNRKAGQLAIAAAVHDDHDALVVADADVDLDAVDLRALLQPLGGVDDRGRTVAMTWAAPFEPLAASWGDRISRAILGSSWHAFALLARLDAHVVVGKLFAVHGPVRSRVAALRELRAYLGEDFELGRRIEAAGGAIHRIATPARSLAQHRSVREVFERYVRWLWVVRAQRPARLLGYPLLLAAAPLLLLASALVAPFDAPAAMIAAALTITTRQLVGWVAAPGRPHSALRAWDGWLADVVLLAAFAAVWRRRSVRWAERTLVVDRHGRLQPRAE